MVTEDRSHRSHELNPRKHPLGHFYPDNSKDGFPRKLYNLALLDDAEMNFIHDVPRILGPGLYGNLGHALGGSAILMANSIRENCLDAKVYSVDLFPTNKQIRNAMFQIERFEVEEYIELCFGGTIEWADKLKDKRFTFVFADADHTYESVKNDFLAWSPLVHKWGYFAFHDTNQDFSHQAIEDTVLRDKRWRERPEYHIHRIRTFERIS